MAEDERSPFRGGRMFTHDPWFGLRDKARFGEFRRWWHREKARAGLGDLTTRQEAEDIYAEWAISHPSKERS